jgi:sigma-B regulation protein RsbU (phosphoserine phosphatase)
MLFSNFISNAIGVVVIMVISRQTGEYASANIQMIAHRISMVFLPFSFLVPLLVTLMYEKPIRSYLNDLRDNTPMSEKGVLEARRKLLNEPFFLIGLDSVVWLSSAVLYSGMFWFYNAGMPVIREAFFQSFFTGLITIAIAFFVFEFVLQRRVVSFFFPKGGLSMTPGTFRIRIRTRLIALLLAINIVPLVALYDDVSKLLPLEANAHQTLMQLQTTMYFQLFVFFVVGVWVVFLVSSNLTRPFEEIIHVLHNIKNGKFNSRVRVTSNDELGYTGDVINEMTRGLMERDRIRHSLSLAQEIQQNLFPNENMTFDGMDMAGRSVYCDETGGDYYDFIPMGTKEERKVGIAIGDVSGHGISSALLMATVRSALRQRVFLPGNPSQVITDVNVQLARDVEFSGDFMTLFFLVVDLNRNELEWVRAGHDPAVVYDPSAGTFNKLTGSGIAMGADAGWVYEQNRKKGLAEGQIILLGTDGVWEAQNMRGERIGKDPIYDVIRTHHELGAKQILDAVFDTIKQFQNGVKNEDDITAIVVKLGK